MIFQNPVFNLGFYWADDIELVKDIVHKCAEAKKKVEDEHQIAGLKRHWEMKMMMRNLQHQLGVYVHTVIDWGTV
jgi:hypothetical protein